MSKRTVFQILALTLLCSKSLAQQQTPVTSDQNIEQQKLDTGRATWNTRFFSNYEYQYSQACPNCAQYNYPWTVQITPGQPASAIDTKNQYRPGSLSIAQVFDKLQGHINNPNDKIEASYDANNGYPTRYKIQVGTSNNNIVSTSIYNFHTLDADQKTLYQNARNLWAGHRISSYDFQYYDMGPNPQNIQWPLFVKVRDNVIKETKDNNGNVVLWSAPHLLTFNGWFDQIKRQLDNNAPYVDNTYNSIKGWAEHIHTVTIDGNTVEFRFTNYQDSGLSP